MVRIICFLFLQLAAAAACKVIAQTVVRYNVAGYQPTEKKVLVVASKSPGFVLRSYKLVAAHKDTTLINIRTVKEKDFGRFGPFEHSYRIDISNVTFPGVYHLLVNDSVLNGTITVRQHVYHGLADFCLGFLRSQRCGNQSAKADSVHRWQNFLPGIEDADSTPVDVSGGWHNTRNDLQDLATDAAITGTLVAAYQRYPLVFNDSYTSQGEYTKNGLPDILDEARWGLDWMIKMHPVKNTIYLKTAAVAESGNYYSKPTRQVQAVFDSTGGLPQLDAAFLSSVFADGAALMQQYDPNYASRLIERAENTYTWAQQFKTNQFSLQLAASNLYRLTHNKKYNKAVAAVHPIEGNSLLFADLPVSACLSWKPELQKLLRQAEKNAFYYPLAFDSGSNAALVNVAIAALRYREVCADDAYVELEQSLADWLLGCNPWGLAMISGLPGVAAVHNPFNSNVTSRFAGALVSGPVTAARWQKLNGVSLLKKDKYEPWQSAAAVYHDDVADYATNEALTNGTAGLVLLFAARANASLSSVPSGFQYSGPVVVRGDSVQKKLAICFVTTGKGPGVKTISQILTTEKARASFFFTPQFLFKYKQAAQTAGSHNYLGIATGSFYLEQPGFANADEAISLLPVPKIPGVSQKIRLVRDPGSESDSTPGSIAIAPTPGADFTEAAAGANSPLYISSDSIFRKIMGKAREMPYGLSGSFLLLPTEAEAGRPDKFYMLLPLLIQDLKNEGYTLVTADEMLGLKVISAPEKTVKSYKKPLKKKHQASKKQRRR